MSKASLPADTFILLRFPLPVDHPMVLVPVDPLYVRSQVQASVNVRFVTVEKFTTVALFPVMVKVPVPVLSALVPVPVQLKVCIVGLLLFTDKSRVPVNSPIVTDTTLKSVSTVQVPPPEFSSKMTALEASGTEYPPEPPENPDQ
jgi:hypothetical protein